MQRCSVVARRLKTLRVGLRPAELQVFRRLAGDQPVVRWLRNCALAALSLPVPQQRPVRRRYSPPAKHYGLTVEVPADDVQRQAFLEAADAAKQAVGTWLRNMGREAAGLPPRFPRAGARSTRTRDRGFQSGRKPTALVRQVASELGVALPPLPTVCPEGHPFDAKNTGTGSEGSRYCIACERSRATRAYHALVAAGRCYRCHRKLGSQKFKSCARCRKRDREDYQRKKHGRPA